MKIHQSLLKIIKLMQQHLITTKIKQIKLNQSNVIIKYHLQLKIKELNRETTQQSKDNEQQSDVAEKAPVEALNNDQQSNSSQKMQKINNLK